MKKYFFAPAMVFVLLTACISTAPNKKSNDAGLAGFYAIGSGYARINTEEISARKLSTPGDRIFVYKVNNNTIVLGEGNPDVNARPMPFEEMSTGIAISLDSAKRLSQWLEKVIASFDNKAKRDSLYLDFKLMNNATIAASALGSSRPEGDDEYIQLRFQYVYSEGIEKSGEVVSFYLGRQDKPGKAKQISYNEIKILLSNLQKP